jgi:Cap4 dsDNA endonuclease
MNDGETSATDVGGGATAPTYAAPTEFHSVDDVCPLEQGGPIARIGFSYQDEIAVSFLLEMLQSPTLLKVHCESHDDILLVRNVDGQLYAEFVQVKAGEINKLWSAADLCRRDAGVGSSVFEISLTRDAHLEHSLFRLVTLRPVAKELKPLTYVRGAPGREPSNASVIALRDEINSRCAGASSKKANGTSFWIDRCYWDIRHDQARIAALNLIFLLKLSIAEGRMLLCDQAEIILDELRSIAKEAGKALWHPNRDLKIITRASLRAWWAQRLDELFSGASASAGGKLAEKMRDAGAGDELIALAVEMRRDYAETVRTSRYMEDGEAERLQARVKSEMMTLRTRYAAGHINLDGIGFLSLCIERLDELNGDQPLSSSDRSAFLKGCMYDIADRCLHRFARPSC